MPKYRSRVTKPESRAAPRAHQFKGMREGVGASGSKGGQLFRKLKEMLWKEKMVTSHARSVLLHDDTKKRLGL